MSQNSSARAKKSRKSGNAKRQEWRFDTGLNHMPLWVSLVGMAGCLALGAGCYGLWILSPAFEGASWIVAAGGVGLGVALWFGQPPETAVSVGDSGIAIENGRDTFRFRWFELKTVRVEGTRLILESEKQTLSFTLPANRNAASLLLKEAALRVPETLDVDAAITQSLPSPEEAKAEAQKGDLADDQLTGSRCAASKKTINLEEDARLCPRCGLIFHKEKLPAQCSGCQAALGNAALRA